MIVVDTSAVIAALLDPAPPAGLVDRLAGAELHAPHLIDVEMLHALRRLLTVGVIEVDRADEVRRDYDDLLIRRYPHTPLGDRVWALRDNLTAYDAAFVALAEALGAPLVTCDARLAGAPGHGADVALFAP